MSTQSAPCTISLSDGTHYDLSSLASSSKDYTAQVGETSYNLNVCRGVVGELYNIEDPDQVGGYINKEEGDFSLGRVNTNLTLSPTNEPMIILKDGSACLGNPYESASTAIRFICSPSDFHAGNPVLVAALPEDDPCHFFFEWKSHVACATNPKAQLETSHYIAFGAILAIAIMTWFGGHTIYNRFYLKRRGISQFPLPSFQLPSFHIPSLSLPTRSGETSNPKWGSWRRSQRNGYSNIRAEDNDEEEGFASRFSLEDEDEDAEDLTGERLDTHALGGETNAWRGANSTANGSGGGGEHGKVGLHQGLLDI